jgi:response regulator RpfG family c-di-GMP phosphodiesterase
MESILFVDDEPNVLSGYRRTLRKKFNITTASSGEEALDILDGAPDDFPVIISDMRMPEMDGIEFFSEVLKRYPEKIRIILTGNADQQTAIDAVNEGQIFRFLNKPCSPDMMIKTLDAGIYQYNLQKTEKVLLEKTLAGSIKLLFDVLAMTNPQIFLYAKRLREIAADIGEKIGIKNRWRLNLASMLYYVAYITIPLEILEKYWSKEPLNEKEIELMSTIPTINKELIENIPRLESVANILYYSSKNFDGSGLPIDDVRGVNIPLESRLLRILVDFIGKEPSFVPSMIDFEKMFKTSGFYDMDLLYKIREHIVGYTEEENEIDEGDIEEVHVFALKVGHVLRADVLREDNEHVIVKKGDRLTPALIEKIRNAHSVFGVLQPVYIKAKKSWEDVEKKKLEREEAERALEAEMQREEEDLEITATDNAVGSIKETLRKLGKKV